MNRVKTMYSRYYSSIQHRAKTSYYAIDEQNDK